MWSLAFDSCNFLAQYPPAGQGSSFTRFLDHTQRCCTVGLSPVNEWSARRRDLFLTTHNNPNRQTSMLQWDSNPQTQQVSCRRFRLRPRGHWDRFVYNCVSKRSFCTYKFSIIDIYNKKDKILCHLLYSNFRHYNSPPTIKKHLRE